MNWASINTTGSLWLVPCGVLPRSESTAESRRCFWWPEGIASPKSLNSPGPKRRRSTTGSLVTSKATSLTVWRMHGDPVGLALRPPSPTLVSRPSSVATRCGWATPPRAGPWHSWPNTWAACTTALSRPERSAARCERWDYVGNAHATSTPTRIPTGPRKKGLIRRLKRMPKNAVLLFLDATILRLFPPLRFAWAFRGQQAKVRISGGNTKRVLFGVINPRTGHRLMFRRFGMRQDDFQAFLRYRRRHYPGRPLWRLLDRAPCHEAIKSQRLAKVLGIALLWLPKQCSELNAMDQLWKELKRLIAANRQFPTDAATKSCNKLAGYVWRTSFASGCWSKSTRTGGRRAGCTPAMRLTHGR